MTDQAYEKACVIKSEIARLQTRNGKLRQLIDGVYSEIGFYLKINQYIEPIDYDVLNHALKQQHENNHYKIQELQLQFEKL